MITETTAISVIAFLALVTALGIAAGLGWMRCARLLAKVVLSRNEWKAAHEALTDRYRNVKMAHSDDINFVCGQREKAWADRDAWKRLASDLQERLDIEAAKRSSITSRGNLTKAAKRKALVDATTAAVARANAADRAEPVRKAA